MRKAKNAKTRQLRREPGHAQFERNGASRRGAITLRKATSKDMPTIARLIRGLAKYEKLTQECRVSPNRLRRDGFGSRRYFETLLALQDGWPIGFALFVLMYSTFRCNPTLYVEDIFVLPEARGRGAGKMLLAEMARLAVKRGCGQIKWMVLDWNDPAIKFYRRLGAKPLREWMLMRLDRPEMLRLARHG